MEQAGSQSPAVVGQIIAGKFRIDRVLAEGGMGLVVAATHLHLDQVVAIKLPRRDICGDGEALGRFTREAKAAAQLKSEHVARVLDAGITEDGSEGQSLARLLEIHGPLDVQTATEYAIQVCEGLAEAHARGIVHRDVKPGNLFLVERAPGWHTVKLLDFGISKASLVGKGNLETSIIMGSPCYMSPEQLRSTATVDQRTDLWSLGVTLYELLAGRSPFDGALPLADLFVTILERPAPNLRDVRPEIPEALAATVARCLERDLDARFQTAAEVARALVTFAPARARHTASRAESMPAILRGRRAGAERSARAADDRPGSDRDHRPVPVPESRGREPSAVSIAPPVSFRIAAKAWQSTLLGPRAAAIAACCAFALLAVALAARPRAKRDNPHAPIAMIALAPSAAAPEARPPGTQPSNEPLVAAPSLSPTVAVDSPPVVGSPARANSATIAVRVGAPLPPPPSTRRALPSGLAPTTVTSRAVAVPAVKTPVSAPEIDPRGGHAVRRPIESSNPYPTP
jgi:serine/threonine-protein kinase